MILINAIGVSQISAASFVIESKDFDGAVSSMPQDFTASRRWISLIGLGEERLLSIEVLLK